MIELVIDYLRDDNASLRAELVRISAQVEALKKTLADTAEALRLYVESYAKADDRIGALKKENDGLRTRNKDVYTALLAANDSTADMRKERDSALGERDALKKENETLRGQIATERQLHNEAQEKHAEEYLRIATATGCHVRDDLAGKIMAIKKENESLKADAEAWKKEMEEMKGKLTSVELLIEALKRIERQRWENVNQVFGTKYPAQMNEGESAKWTDGGAAVAHSLDIRVSDLLNEGEGAEWMGEGGSAAREAGK